MPELRLASPPGPGKIYIVEFWATWCGVLHAFMPHLAELRISVKNSARGRPSVVHPRGKVRLTTSPA